MLAEEGGLPPVQPEAPHRLVPVVPIILIDCCCWPCVCAMDPPPKASHDDDGAADANWPNAFEDWMADWAAGAGAGAAEKSERMSCLTSLVGGWGVDFEAGGA